MNEKKNQHDTAAADPMPQPPVPPGEGDCCHSGCTFCVDDLYQEALERYRADLKAWQARQGQP
jgi:hypothetical protein